MQELLNSPVAVKAPKKAQPTASVTWHRDGYGALCVRLSDGAARTKLARAYRQIQQIMAELEAGDVDEHRAPAWETGAEFQNHRRHGWIGESINVNLYGLDIVHRQPLAVVQVRQYRKTKYGGNVRKNWFLVGRNERTGQPFAHPVSGRIVQNAVDRDRSPESPVTASRAWIFEIPIKKLPQVLRHGDVAAVPVRALPGGEREIISGSPAGTRIIDSHVLQAAELVQVGDRLYARDPLLQHLKGQHADVEGQGWHRIQIGLRAEFYAFARPTVD